MNKKILCIIMVIIIVCSCAGCLAPTSTNGSRQDNQTTIKVTGNIQENQPTPTDIDYSLERYNLIRRAYWVNGQREKADTLVCEIQKPLGYVLLLTEFAVPVATYAVDGKVSSLNSFLTPDSEYYEVNGGEYRYTNDWIADVDGSYGENDSGIFFFTPDGNYYEWTGLYLYSDIPFLVEGLLLNQKG